MPPRLIAGLSLLMLAGTSSASSCAAKYDYMGETCICDEQVHQLRVPAPEGFSLFAICSTDGNHVTPNIARGLPPERFDGGSYFYRGARTMTGSIVKADDPALGHTVIFFPSRPSPSTKAAHTLPRLKKFSELDSISLIVDEKKVGTSNLTATEKVSWCAQATIALKEIEIFVADTEGEGPVAKKFEVLRRGKFRKC
ncbi:hypothetical protein [Azonexus sp.]|uniref:hypothetical protein n=1 Tax=Azonexus sp. TaxID=1872668 RepID=UPI0027BAF319|nr:hypothetical protein [Azonexus sp.]